ncbi:hypothetical protein [Microbacterium rhizophilus]|uniref:hypothetical protein n=1 Tax=Microbacterium rhizophilus TaxID=3138934 RepID=UPI0031ED32D9
MPIVLPHVIAVASGEHRFVLLVHGAPEPEPVTRAELGAALTRIASAFDGPVRVEVREANGVSYADILEPPPTTGDTASEPRQGGNGFAVTYQGFVAGEEILIAVVDRVEHADADGHLTLSTDARARSRRDRRARRDVIVFGSTSGTTIIGAID